MGIAYTTPRIIAVCVALLCQKRTDVGIFIYFDHACVVVVVARSRVCVVARCSFTPVVIYTVGEFTMYPDGGNPLVQQEFEELMGKEWILPLAKWKQFPPFKDDVPRTKESAEKEGELNMTAMQKYYSSPQKPSESGFVGS
jgi:hypothetical protein